MMTNLMIFEIFNMYFCEFDCAPIIKMSVSVSIHHISPVSIDLIKSFKEITIFVPDFNCNFISYSFLYFITWDKIIKIRPWISSFLNSIFLSYLFSSSYMSNPQNLDQTQWNWEVNILIEEIPFNLAHTWQSKA